MERLSLSKIAEFAGAEIKRGSAESMIERVSTDSRTIKPGELFVALHGENFDAHNFLEQVAKSGAAGAIVAEQVSAKLPLQFAILRSNDTLAAYQNLAANYRKTLPLKVLCITGSNGKTSTKDFAAAILGRAYRVTKTEGNFNNHVGLPRTILQANREDQFAVWEIGMNHPGEIAALARIASPDAALVTNVGIAHIAAARSCLCRVPTWCRTRCWRWQPAAPSASHSRTAPPVLPLPRSQKLVSRFARLTAFNSSPTATTPIPIR